MALYADAVTNIRCCHAAAFDMPLPHMFYADADVTRSHTMIRYAASARYAFISPDFR